MINRIKNIDCHQVSIIINRIKENKLTKEEVEIYNIQKIYFEYMIDEYNHIIIRIKLINDYVVKKDFYAIK